MTGSSKKDTDLFIISGEQLQALEKRGSGSPHCQGGYREDIAKRVRSHPFTEELVWMTPEEEEKRIRQAAINGVLDTISDKVSEKSWEIDTHSDDGFQEIIYISEFDKIIAELRQQAPAPVAGRQP